MRVLLQFGVVLDYCLGSRSAVYYYAVHYSTVNYYAVHYGYRKGCFYLAVIVAIARKQFSNRMDYDHTIMVL